MSEVIIKCPECGREIPAGAAICPNCGYPVERTEAIMKCPECGSDIRETDEKCANCGCPLKRSPESALVSRSNSKKWIIGIVLVAAGVVFAFLSYRTRFMGDYNHYADVIERYKNNIREYRDTQQEMLDEADLYKGGFFKSSYKSLANSYQDLIDDAEDSIAQYKKKQIKILIPASLLLAAALASVGVGVYLIIKK